MDAQSPHKSTPRLIEAQSGADAAQSAHTDKAGAPEVGEEDELGWSALPVRLRFTLGEDLNMVEDKEGFS